MYLLARLNLDAQAISVAQEYKDLKVTTDASPLKAASRREGSGQGSEGRNDLPGRHARPLDSVLARRRRHRPRQGHRTIVVPPRKWWRI